MSIDETRGSHHGWELARLQHRVSELESRMADGGLDNKPVRESRGGHLRCDDAPIGYQLLDAEGRITYVNREWCRIIGYSAESVIGRWFGEFLPPGHVDEFRKRFVRFKKERAIKDTEFVIICKNDTRKNISFNGRVEYTGDGNVARIHCFLQDITDRKRTEEALKRSEEWFRTLSESAPLGIFLTDADGRTIYTNGRVQEIFGLSGEEIKGYEWGRIVHAEDREELLERVRRSVLDNKAFSAAFRIIAPGGELRWLSVRMAPLLSREGKQIGRVGTIEDITDLKTASAKLKENEIKFRQLFETVPDGIIVFDGETRQFLDVSETALSMYGYSRDELLRMTETDITMEKDRSDLSILETLSGKREFVPFRYHRKRDGTVFPVEISACTFEFRGRRVVVNIVRDISQRVAAENVLRINEHKFRQFFENSVVGMALMEPDGSFRIVNDSFHSTLGYTQEEILSMKLADITHPDDLPMIEGKIKELHSGACQHFQVEKRFIHGDGHTIWGIVDTVVIPGEEGEKPHLILQFQDVTDRKKACEAIMESEERNRLISENLPIVVYSALPDKHSTNVFVSGRIEELTGYSGQRFMDDPELYNTIIHEDDREYVWEKISEHRERKTLLDVEYRIRTGSGKTKWIRDKAKPELDEQGEISKINGFMEDITKQKLAEAALLESEQKYGAIVDNVEFGIAVISKQMEVLSVNNRIMRWFPNIDVSKKPFCYEVFNIPPKSAVCSNCPALKTFKDGEIHEMVTRTPVGKGVRNYRVIVNPLKDEKGEVFAAIESVEDVTGGLNMEEELLRSEKHRSISIVIGGVAHDFNNILASLMGNISLIKQKAEDQTDLSELIDEVELAADRARRLTNQLDAFSRGEAPFKSTLSIGEIIRESVEFTLHGSSIACQYDLHDDLHPVDVDADQIDQVINNILINSMQAMPDGGTIKITGKNVILGKKRKISVPVGNYVMISISDDGTGIPESDLPLIFEPFFTTKVGGTGLGLALCLAIVKRHGGDIHVESRAGVGTTVHIYLPGSVGKVSEGPDRQASKHCTGCRILVLDDEDAIRRLLGRELDGFGYSVECAADGEETVNLYEEAMETGHLFDAVILDLTIRGGMGGRETLSRLREIDPGVRAIATSGYLNDPVMKNCKKYGFIGALAKPYKIDELGAILRQILDADS